MELALITGLCVIGLGIYLGALEIAMAIGQRRFHAHEIRINCHLTLVKKENDGTPS